MFFIFWTVSSFLAGFRPHDSTPRIELHSDRLDLSFSPKRRGGVTAQRCIFVSIILYHWIYRGTNIKIGFIAFTTIGYGDLAPQTAIGRSIFVFWALFGVGAMTILFAGTCSELRSLIAIFNIP